MTDLKTALLNAVEAEKVTPNPKLETVSLIQDRIKAVRYLCIERRETHGMSSIALGVCGVEKLGLIETTPLTAMDINITEKVLKEILRRINDKILFINDGGAPSAYRLLAKAKRTRRKTQKDLLTPQNAAQALWDEHNNKVFKDMLANPQTETPECAMLKAILAVYTTVG